MKWLEQIVQQFNEGFEQWERETGNVANFSWTYKDDKKLMELHAVSALQVDGVDRIIFRRELATSSEDLKKMMDQAKAEADSAGE